MVSREGCKLCAGEAVDTERNLKIILFLYTNRWWWTGRHVVTIAKCEWNPRPLLWPHPGNDELTNAHRFNILTFVLQTSAFATVAITDRKPIFECRRDGMFRSPVAPPNDRGKNELIAIFRWKKFYFAFAAHIWCSDWHKMRNIGDFGREKLRKVTKPVSAISDGLYDVSHRIWYLPIDSSNGWFHPLALLIFIPLLKRRPIDQLAQSTSNPSMPGACERWHKLWIMGS
jgi:hypothetical protein